MDGSVPRPAHPFEEDDEFEEFDNTGIELNPEDISDESLWDKSWDTDEKIAESMGIKYGPFPQTNSGNN
eukprot:CAMPEP_0175067158 /NCGR_PEP_ID=MMETSP0052_2-20121109/16932_1 /TAXON_ID=51329 ORGANISM="Polytomella parva, Strain SAG 63-3" /NCGR_SAMPLE_ID=MMETSP0052_2 /ASSEMBLY_ACC=CAM_ASM_000194 /LENGTH=68 /DNA_ID=CAMNT_0016333987 /DNA_START=49 /DNA_END=255 /DNA_ORIENTATION=+